MRALSHKSCGTALAATRTCTFGRPIPPVVESASGSPWGAPDGGHMRRTGYVSATVCAMAVAIGGAHLAGANGQDKDEHRDARPCSEATIRGDYGIQIQGTRPAPGGATESVVGVILRNYDGRGNISQVDNVKGSITGIVPDREGFGTYE